MALFNYISLYKLHDLDPDPMILVGKKITYFLKLDGTNFCIRTNSEGEKCYTTKHTVRAQHDVVSAAQRSREWDAVCELHENNPEVYAFYELLRSGESDRAKVSPAHYEIHMMDYLIGIDMATEENGYLPPALSNMIFKRWGVPTAPVMGNFQPETLQELYDIDNLMITTAARRRREGAVGKSNDGVYRWKCKHYTAEGKVFMPKKPRKTKYDDLPRLPDDDMWSNVDNVLATLGKEDYLDKAKSMPMLAKLMNEDMKKQGTGPPVYNLFYYYQVIEKKLREEH